MIRRNVLAVMLASVMAVGSGCAGFGDGISHAFTGKNEMSPPAADHKTGYDMGVMIGNLLIAGISYGSAYLVHGKKNSNGTLPGKAE